MKKTRAREGQDPEGETCRTPPGTHVGVGTSCTVLHIDDDPNDTELLRAATRKAEAPCVLHNVEDADQAIAYLNGQGIYADRARFAVPGLILLDLKMPRTTGFDLLKWIRQHRQIAHLPVVVLSGSELQEDIQRAYDAGADSYLVKPLTFEALVELVRNLNTLWLVPRNPNASPGGAQASASP